MNITKGKRLHDRVFYRTTDDYRKVYDRLRKRSYRRTVACSKLNWWTDSTIEPWYYEDHQAYIAGVRDALNEVIGQ